MAQLRIEFPGSEIGEIIQMFKEEGAAILAQVTLALERLDATGVRRGAHALKGCCDNFGARSLAALCQQMERDARVGDIADAGSLLEQVRHEYQRVECALEQEFHTESKS
jgi:HPt (histidine-containing phosphotransfer) domain-containing protein